MKKEVQITIKSDIKTEDNRDNIELTVNGTAYTKDNCYYLCYKESDESGFGDSSVIMKFKGKDSFIMTRNGASSSQLRVELNKRNLCSYATPYGSIMIGIYGTKIDTDFKNDCNADMIVEYSIDADMALLSENKLHINIRECKN